MATFTYTFMPVLLVLKEGGSMNLIELAEKLRGESQRHFPDFPAVERAITRYTGCLLIESGDRVRFNHNAKTYARSDIMEREVDVLLHEHVPNMKRFELYPHINHKNSPTCPIGVPWGHIPRDEMAIKRGGDPYMGCDYGPEERGCYYGYDVKRDLLKRLGFKVDE